MLIWEMGSESSFLGKKIGVKEVSAPSIDHMRGQGGETKLKKRRWQRTEAVADGGGKVVGRRRGKECVCMLPCVNGDGDGGGRYTMY